MRKTARARAFPAVVLLLTLCGARVSWPQSRPRLIQSLDIRIPAPPTPFRSAGNRHLAYELQIANFRSVDIALSRVEVLNAEDKACLGSLNDAELTKSLGRPGARPDLPDKRLISAGMGAVVFLWLALDDSSATPNRLRHRIEFELVRPSGREAGSVVGGEVQVRPEAPVVLGPPLRGGPWVALYDPFLTGGHRTSIYTLSGRARIPGRFAIDWIRLENDATHARGDASRIANWHGYGADVLAVADGVVADAQDDIPEEAALSGASRTPIPLENASGNYVALDLGEGRHAFYEHLKHGSLRVRVGDRVKAGQVLGSLGNSGSSSSGPHLHFHVSDANSPLAAEGLPYVLGGFEGLGGFERIGAFEAGERWKPAPPGASGTRRMELPAANTVVMFGP